MNPEHVLGDADTFLQVVAPGDNDEYILGDPVESHALKSEGDQKPNDLREVLATWKMENDAVDDKSSLKDVVAAMNCDTSNEFSELNHFIKKEEPWDDDAIEEELTRFSKYLEDNKNQNWSHKELMDLDLKTEDKSSSKTNGVIVSNISLKMDCSTVDNEDIVPNTCNSRLQQRKNSKNIGSVHSPKSSEAPEVIQLDESSGDDDRGGDFSLEQSEPQEPSRLSNATTPKQPEETKPENSFSMMITKAILSTPSKRCTLGEILTYMSENFPDHTSKVKNLKTSLLGYLGRSNFVKILHVDESSDPYWTLNPVIERKLLARLFRSSSEGGQQMKRQQTLGSNCDEDKCVTNNTEKAPPSKSSDHETVTSMTSEHSITHRMRLLKQEMTNILSKDDTPNIETGHRFSSPRPLRNKQINLDRNISSQNSSVIIQTNCGKQVCVQNANIKPLSRTKSSKPAALAEWQNTNVLKELLMSTPSCKQYETSKPVNSDLSTQSPPRAMDVNSSDDDEGDVIL